MYSHVSRPMIAFVAACLLTSLNHTARGQEERARRPNIVWIVAENFDLDFGCYGAKNVETPNVDRLAADGVRYTNVYSTSPVCAPSRSAISSNCGNCLKKAAGLSAWPTPG